MTGVFWVAVGGALGASSRHLVNLALGRIGVPGSTLLVNVLGSLLLGLLVYWLAVREVAWWQHSGGLLLATGFCGAFTTMSALALETYALADSGQTGAAMGYAAVNVSLSVAGLVAGAALARSLL